MRGGFGPRSNSVHARTVTIVLVCRDREDPFVGSRVPLAGICNERFVHRSSGGALKISPVSSDVALTMCGYVYYFLCVCFFMVDLFSIQLYKQPNKTHIHRTDSMGLEFVKQ